MWKNSGSESILLEIHAVVECVAPSALHADRFLPPTPLRIVIDHAMADRSDDPAVRSAKLEKGDIFRLLDRGPMRKKLLPAMLAAAQTLATTRMAAVKAEATATMEAQLQDESNASKRCERSTTTSAPRKSPPCRRKKPTSKSR